MSKIEKLEIKSRSSEGLVLWKVTDPVTMNTLISPQANVLVIVKSGNVEKTTIVPKTLCNILNPGKDKTFFGGNKECKTCDIYAVDQKTEFRALWGFGEQHVALKGERDNIQCFLRAHGSYSFKIQNHTVFLNKVERNGDSIAVSEVDNLVITRAIEVIKSYFVSNATGKTLNEVNEIRTIYEDDIKSALNSLLGTYGMVCTSFTIDTLTYNKEYLAFLGDLSDISQDNVLVEEGSKGARTKIDTEGEYIAKVYAPKKAADAIGSGKEPTTPKAPKAPNPKLYIQCSNCQTYNEASNKYCSNCGQQLR